MRRSKEIKAPKTVIKAVETVLEWNRNCHDMDKAALALAMAAERDDLAELACLCKNAEMRIVTHQAEKKKIPERTTFRELYGVKR